MNLNAFHGKHVSVTDRLGNCYTGIADFFPARHCMHEYDIDEDSLIIDHHLIPLSMITSIEEIEMHGMAELRTERMALRRYRAEDAQDLYHAIGTDPEADRYSGWNPYATEELAEETVQRFISSYKDEHFYGWVMDADDVVIGTIGAYDFQEDTIEVGFSVAKAWQGRGYAGEALKKVLEYLTENEGIACATAWCAGENIASKKVLEKSGMTFVRSEPDGIEAKGQRFDKLFYEYRPKTDLSKSQPEELHISLRDEEWPWEGTDHDRRIVRAIVADEGGYYYFVRADRDDEFGRCTCIETSGGGAEEGEDLQEALQRELREELGAEVKILCRIGIVDDYYNLIHRHNINHYYLCRPLSFGKRHLTEDETERFHLSLLKLTYEEAMREYEKNRSSRLGRLIYQREAVILRRAKEILDSCANTAQSKEP